MSRDLFNAPGDYLHSPVDDIESFFWVVVWSVFFNKVDKGAKSIEEQTIQEDLSENHKGDAMEVLLDLHHRGNHSSITLCFLSVLLEWWMKVRDRHRVWVRDVVVDAPDNAGGEYYLPYFHRFALEGVVEVLEVLKMDWKELDSETWTPSA